MHACPVQVRCRRCPRHPAVLISVLQRKFAHGQAVRHLGVGLFSLHAVKRLPDESRECIPISIYVFKVSQFSVFDDVMTSGLANDLEVVIGFLFYKAALLTSLSFFSLSRHLCSLIVRGGSSDFSIT